MAGMRLFLVLAVLGNVLLAYLLVFGQQGVFTYLDTKHRRDEMAARLERVENRSLEISREIRLLKTDQGFLERTIRQQTHFLAPREVLYLLPGASGRTAETTGDAAHEE
jgi:cell division protein FtsB